MNEAAGCTRGPSATFAKGAQYGSLWTGESRANICNAITCIGSDQRLQFDARKAQVGVVVFIACLVSWLYGARLEVQVWLAI